MYTLVSMLFDPNLSFPSNPYKWGARAGFGLAFFKLIGILSGAKDPKLTAEAFGSR